MFIATKLVRHFVSDDPRNEAAKIAKVFSDTEGDLAAVSNAIVELDEVSGYAVTQSKVGI